ncbi:MAG: glutamine synthetase family protein [Tabrizicola sp.]
MALDDFLAAPGSRFATVAMTDSNGLLRGQMVSASSLRGIARAGMRMAPAQLALYPTDVHLNMPGVNDDSGDFHDDPSVIDPASVRRMPWARPGHDLLVLSNFTGQSAELCPRSILTRVLARASDAGLFPKYGMELEYTLLDETPESARAKGYRNLKPATLHASHDLILYQAVQTEWYEALAAIFEPLKIDLAKMHEEIGAGEGLGSADQLVLPKNFLRAMALRQGRSVTFMPRWNEAADSQSIHLHMSLKDKAGTPVFRDASQKNGVSQLFRWFLGGLQAHGGDLGLIFLPTVNSYRRFAPGTFAPPGLTWDYENRTPCFRLVGHDAISLRAENRLPGADTKPYLSTADTLAAGVAGILGQIEPAPEVIGSGYAQEPTRDFARSMPEAIDRLRGSALARDWLGDHLVDGLTPTREAQDQEFHRKLPGVELQRFFDIG